LLTVTEISQIDDDTLLSRLREGDDLAFKIIFDRFYVRLCVFANRYLRDHDASKDVVNDVFIRFLGAPKCFQHIDHVLSSLYLATKHAALNHQKARIRSKKRDSAFHAEVGEEESFYLIEVMRVEMLNTLYEAISELPKKAGKIIRETYLEGRSNQEVAEEMGISMQTLRNQKSRALSILRRRLNRDSFELLVGGAFVAFFFPS